MAEQTPLFVDTDGIYGADELGLPFRDLIGEGVVEAGDLAVSQRSTGADMSVDVAAGACWVKGDTDANLQPTYRCYNDDVVNVALDAADATNPRIDIIIAQVNDSTFAGSNKSFVIDKVTGTPAVSPAAPATPDSALLLAQVAVAANAASIVTADITDERVRAATGGGVASGARVLASDVIAADVSIVQTWADICTVTFTTTGPSTNVRLRAQIRVANSGAAATTVVVGLFDGSNNPVGEAASSDSNANSNVSFHLETLIEDLAAGSHTYKMRAMKNSANGSLAARDSQTFDSIAVNHTALYAEAV